MKIYVTSENRKVLIKRGYKNVSFIQLNKILEEFKITIDELSINKQYQFILNSEIEKRIKNCYSKNHEKLIYQIDKVTEELLWNFQDFFDRENMTVNLYLIDWKNEWKDLWEVFPGVIST